MFEETPKVDFTVTVDGKVVYRDAIIFDSIAQLRSTSQVEREAMFQARYDNWLATVEAQQSVEEE
jgi:hypothetical protein